MSHHGNHHTGQIVEGVALGLLFGAAISENQQRHPGRGYGEAVVKTGSSAIAGAAVLFLAFAWGFWALLMHPLVTIPSLFLVLAGWKAIPREDGSRLRLRRPHEGRTRRAFVVLGALGVVYAVESVIFPTTWDLLIPALGLFLLIPIWVDYGPPPVATVPAPAPEADPLTLYPVTLTAHAPARRLSIELKRGERYPGNDRYERINLSEYDR